MLQDLNWSEAKQNSELGGLTSVTSGRCQADSFAHASFCRIPRFIDHVGRSREHFRRFGLLSTIHKITGFLVRASKLPINLSAKVAKPVVAPNSSDVSLCLQPGELVEVKSAEEITATLDPCGTLKGLRFLPAMTLFCGKRFTVLKRMERMYQEESGTLRKVKNTVLLNEVMCDGLLMRCDRSCFFYWREAWLKRVNDGPRSG